LTVYGRIKVVGSVAHGSSTVRSKEKLAVLVVLVAFV